MSEAIRFSHVYFSYEQNKDVVEASKCTINDVSFTINKGEYVALIGHNGSGKSTIAKIIVGILEAFTDGNENDGVYIDGIKMTENNYQSLQKKIGMVFRILITSLSVQLFRMILPLVWKMLQCLMIK